MYFITGCTGLVGSFIARKLLQQGNHLRALKRKTSDLSLVADIADKIEWIEGDILDITGLEKSIEGVDTVIHTAAIVSFSNQSKKLMFKTNVEGTANIVNVCIKKGVRKLCHLSSIAAIGNPPSPPKSPRKWADENIQWEDSDHNSFYAKTKYLSELEVWRGMEEGLDVVILNPAVVLGPGDWKKGSSKIFQYVWKQYPFYTSGTVNYIDVRDLAEITLQLIKADVNNERFIIFADNISYKELFNIIAMNFDKRKPNIKVSPYWTAFAWRFEKIRSFFTGKPPLVTKDIVASSLNSLHYDNSKMKNILNYNFKDINDTINWTCDELKRRYGLKKNA